MDFGAGWETLQIQIDEVSKRGIPGLVLHSRRTPILDAGKLLPLAIQEIRTKCRALRYLSVTFGYEPLPKAVLASVAEMIALEFLELRDYGEGAGLDFAILAALPKLKTVALEGGCDSPAPLFNLPSLEQLAIWDIGRKAPLSLKDVSKAEHLKSLTIVVDADVVTDLDELGAAKSLREITLGNKPISASTCAALAKLPNLARVFLLANSIECFDYLAECPNLKAIGFFPDERLKGELVAACSRMKNVEDVTFIGTSDFLYRMKILDAMPHVKIASIGRLPYEDPPNADSLALIARALGKLENLKATPGGRQGDWAAELLASLPGLSNLDIFGWEVLLSDTFACAIAKSKSIKRLVLTAGLFSSLSYEGLAAMPSLSHLCLNYAGGCRFDDIRALIAPGRIKELFIYGSPYFTPECIAKISELPNRPFLSLDCSVGVGHTPRLENAIIWPFSAAEEWRYFAGETIWRSLAGSLVFRGKEKIPSAPALPEGLGRLYCGLKPCWLTDKKEKDSKYSDKYVLLLLPLEYFPGMCCIAYTEKQHLPRIAAISDEKTLKALQNLDSTSIDWNVEGLSRIKCEGLKWELPGSLARLDNVQPPE
ncbi:MAG: hypothetical protein WC712_07540 [Candidatus Brocadiia bacterium]